MTNYTIKDLKKWLKKKYPHIYYSANINFAAERAALTLSKYMNDKLRAFKVSGLKLEVD
ncbi:hypothetical protein QN289_03925 [Latilactobacillus curvatus]|uniref:hypothetical protein n=1 Tax=Latilactobacillus curvatus TaxID=28038 RepID=UPI0024DF3B5E|nr:hypothetical protein [Latilactobacillus curvatus]WIE01515.1 hypothetical protein QN289_03925 [Latilactobacillus curvatus]